MGIDLLESAQRALKGSMSCGPEEISPGRYRCFHNAMLVPAGLGHSVWDGADCTSRALDCWYFLRQITGDSRTGEQVEQGMLLFLMDLLDPQSGLPFFSDPTTNTIIDHTHMWDVGRMMRFLVRRAIISGDAEYRRWCEQAFNTLRSLAVEVIHDGHQVAWFPSDSFHRGLPCSHVAGSAWVLRAGQLLEPLVVYAAYTGNEAWLHWARKLARGALSGKEIRRECPEERPLLNHNGAFRGHYHGHISSFVGMVKLARLLYEVGKKDEAIDIVQTILRVYSWIFNAQENINAAGSYGWFPENTDNLAVIRVLCETCSTADMIKLAIELATCERIDPSCSDVAWLWEDVERFARNALLKAQWRATQRNIDRIAPLQPSGIDTHLVHDIAHRLDGGWAAVFYPNDLTYLGPRGTPGLAISGCCTYSGPRALYALWHNAVTDSGETASVNLHLDRATSVLSITSVEEDDTATLTVAVHAPRNVRVRRPSWVPPDSESIIMNNKPVPYELVRAGRWWQFRDASPGDSIVVRYPLVRRTTKELLAPSYGYGYVESGERVEYQIEWRGDEVVRIHPEGTYFPFERGFK